MGEVINWEEKYVSYVEGDLRRDIQELKDGQKALDTKIGSEVTRLRSEDILELKNGQKELRSDIKALDTKIDSVETKLDTKIDSVETKLSARIDRLEESLREEIKEVGAKIDRFLRPVILLLAAGVIGGLIKAFIG